MDLSVESQVELLKQYKKYNYIIEECDGCKCDYCQNKTSISISYPSDLRTPAALYEPLLCKYHAYGEMLSWKYDMNIKQNGKCDICDQNKEYILEKDRNYCIECADKLLNYNYKKTDAKILKINL